MLSPFYVTLINDGSSAMMKYFLNHTIFTHLPFFAFLFFAL